MKQCPFCAEDIKDEAIKCRYCGSFLSAATPEMKASAGVRPAAGAVPESAPAPASSPPAQPDVDDIEDTAATLRAERQARAAERDREQREDEVARERKILYSGYPSWRAFVGAYALTILGGIFVPIISQWIAGAVGASTANRVLSALIPLAVAVIAFFIIGFYRKARVFRVSTSNIETEFGLLSKKIDVIELWRCRDVRYKQSLMDRMLGIAHIEIYTADVTTPNLELRGMPASRQLFEKLRDSIEIQRHRHNVIGFVE